MRKLLYIVFIFTTCETFASSAWTQKATFGGGGRHRPFSFVLGNKAYVGGGWQGTVMYMDFWEYDPSSNTWTQKAQLPISMWTCTGFGIGSKGYVTWGTLNSTMYVYNLFTNTWSVGPTCPGSNFWESGGWVYNGKGYLPATNAVYVFDPATNGWTTVSTTHATGGGTGFQIGSKGYAALSNFNDIWEYDIISNVWTQRAPFPGEQRTQAIGFEAGGRGYVCCGDGFVNDNLNDCWEYNPATNSWTSLGEGPFATRENGTGFTLGTRGYICCGTNGINFQDLWELNPFAIAGNEDMQQEKTEAVIFPNPMKETCQLKITTTGNITDFYFQLFDAQGKMIKHVEIKNSNLIIERENLTSGTYVYYISNTNKTVATGKLIVE